MGIVLFSGCGSPEPEITETPSIEPTVASEITPVPKSTQTPTQSAAPPINIDPSDLDGISVRFVHPWGGQTTDTLEMIATQFSLSNPWGIWVTVEALGSEMLVVDALAESMDDGNPPGLIALHPYQLSSLDGQYFSVSLTNYIDDPEWGLNGDAQADIPSVFFEPFTIDETLTALPVAPQMTVIFYNQTWAEELGYSEFPKDTTAFRQQSCGATFGNLDDGDRENDGTGGWLVNRDPAVIAAWQKSFGGLLPLDGALRFNDEAGKASFNYLKTVFDEGCFWIGRQADPYYYFANRYALMYAGRLDQVQAQTGWMSIVESQDQWTVSGFPGEGGEFVVIDGPGLMVTAETSEEQLAAWLFARHLIEPEVQAALVRSLFTLPVRTSAMDKLADFAADYPQWAEGAALVDQAVALPVSGDWGVAQWVLQDAVNRLLPSLTNDTDAILQELDQMIGDIGARAP